MRNENRNVNRKNKKRQVNFVESAAILAAASLFARVLGFVYRVPMTNMITDEGNGIYMPAYSIYAFFFILSSAGLPAAISKMVSERRAKGRYRDAYIVFRSALTIATVLGLVCFAVLFFGAEWFTGLINQPRSYYSLLALAPTVFIVAIMGVFRGYYMGLGRVVSNAASQVVDQLFNAVFSVLCCYLLMNDVLFPKGTFGSDSYALGAAGASLGTGIGALAGLVFVVIVYLRARRGILSEVYHDRRPRYEPRERIIGGLMSIAIPIILGTAVSSIINIIDSSMGMSRLMDGAGFSEVEATALLGQLSGKYATMTTLPISISTQLSVAAIPSIAASNALRDKKAVKKKINMALRLAMIVAFPSAVGLGVLAPQILSMLFGSNSEGGMLITVGAVSIIFMSLTQIATGMLQSIGRVKIPIYAALLGVCVKVPLNYLLIGTKELNIVGAVISTVMFCLVGALFNWGSLSRIIRIKPDIKGVLVKPAIASFVMGLVTFCSYYLSFYVSGSNTLSVLVSILLSVVSYFLALLAVGGINREDLERLPGGRRLVRFVGM